MSEPMKDGAPEMTVLGTRRIVVRRKAGERQIYTVVAVAEDGSPLIEMSMDDFRALVIREMAYILPDMVKNAGSMWNVWTQATTEERIRDAWAKSEPEQRIIKAFDSIVEQMKADTVPVARFVR